jgi:hypothetical protein
MELSRLLNQMCHETLAEADIKAIRKARGFGQKETASRAAFESFFLTSIGLDGVMQTLSDEEIATLYLLAFQAQEVDISFFERLYGSARSDQKYYSGTFTQQYRPTFDCVKQNLVRKGVLVMAEVKQRGESVQMERWRYRFPPEFVAYLPPLIRHPHKSQAQGEVNANIVRQKLLEVVGGPIVSSQLPKEPFALTLVAGTLYLGERPITGAGLVEWQRSAWQVTSRVILPNDPTVKHPTEVIPHILKTLQPDEWVTVIQLEPLLRTWCFGAQMPSVAQMCEAGRHWGLLERLQEGAATYYRLPFAKPAEALTPDQFLTPGPDGQSALVDLRRIPLADLEQINRLAALQVQHNNLIAVPGLVKLGRLTPAERQSPLAAWLCQHIPAFAQNMVQVEEKWGQNIVHLNLRLARVRDLSLRVQLERDLKGNLIVLSDQFVAFPAGLANEVEKSVRKAGFVVKAVRP